MVKVLRNFYEGPTALWRTAPGLSATGLTVAGLVVAGPDEGGRDGMANGSGAGLGNRSF